MVIRLYGGRFWLVMVFVLMAALSLAACSESKYSESSSVSESKKIPDGVQEKLYNESLDMFHKLNVTYAENGMPSKEVTNWVYEYAMSVDTHPSDYTEKEQIIIKSFQSYVVNVGSVSSSFSMKTDESVADSEEQISTSRSVLAEALEVSEDY
ncbi:hypothetical protein [Paenibacillus polymyxa]|uniref:hypothetical protein n=1 Tax=Paenibacillus polymyxa TaxID=1406 RepID=UPI00234B35E0|nr:hypothetical protein [Paenibacillus polymyxa]WCM61381.1 hypothetical protein OYT09_26205 [Paenibacillus polymyxa]